MTEQRKTFLRAVMELAWRKFRFERRASTFSAALRHAWSWHKGAAGREAAAERFRTAPARRTLYLRPTAQSPIGRSLTGQAYAYTRSREAGRLTSRLGA